MDSKAGQNPEEVPVRFPVMFADNVKPVILEDRRYSLRWNWRYNCLFTMNG